MARYIKVNRKVAEFLKLENDRNTVKDGNYLLWQGDMLAFGPLTALPETLAMIGGIALMPHEAREEQDGTNNRVLPTATDERFVVAATNAVEGEANQEPTEEVGENDNDGSEDTDTAANEETNKESEVENE